MSSTTKTAQSFQRELAVRLALVPVLVVICYLFDWWSLRAFTVSVLVDVSTILHVPMHRIGVDLVDLNGRRIQFGIACTMVDAFFGVIPLVWLRGIPFTRNLSRLVAGLVAVFALNIVRLEVGFVAIHHAVPWWLAHECVAGVAYFCIFLLIMRVRAWERSDARTPKQQLGFQLQGAPG